MNLNRSHLLVLLISSSLPFLSFCHALSQGTSNTISSVETNSFEADFIAAETLTQKANVFYNKNGLSNEIIIEEPLREMRATSRTDRETMEELIENISIWVPRMYRQNFCINPRCIIILERTINRENRAEVRFGVAMRCTSRRQLLKTRCI